MNDLPEYFEIAEKVVERAERGLPQDRWFRGDQDMIAIVKAYIGLRNACANMHNDIIKSGSTSMGIGEE
jgi:hypothetical protein